MGFLTHAHLPCICPLVRHKVRCGYRRFSVLLGQQPSLHGLLRPFLACVPPFHRYYAAARLPAAVHVGLIAHRLLPPFRPSPAAEGHRVSRFSCAQRAPSFGACMGSSTPQCARDALARYRTPQCCLPVSLTPSALLVVAISELIDFRDTQPPLPLSNASRATLRQAPAWLGVRTVSLVLSCMTLSFTTSRRFIPMHPS
jgi:hypothetical protein